MIIHSSDIEVMNNFLSKFTVLEAFEFIVEKYLLIHF